MCGLFHNCNGSHLYKSTKINGFQFHLFNVPIYKNILWHFDASICTFTLFVFNETKHKKRRNIYIYGWNCMAHILQIIRFEIDLLFCCLYAFSIELIFSIVACETRRNFLSFFECEWKKNVDLISYMTFVLIQ